MLNISVPLGCIISDKSGVVEVLNYSQQHEGGSGLFRCGGSGVKHTIYVEGFKNRHALFSFALIADACG